MASHGKNSPTQSFSLSAGQVPRRLARRARLLSLLGPGLVGFFVVVMLGIAITLFLSVLLWSVLMDAYFVILPLLVAGIVLRAMWFRTAAPEGVQLPTHWASEIGEIVNEPSTPLKGDRFSEVIIVPRFGTRAVSLRWRGSLARREYCLVLDYPLLAGLAFDDLALLMRRQRLLLRGSAIRISQRYEWSRTLRERLLRSFSRELSFRPSLVRETRTRDRKHTRERWLLRVFEPFFSWYIPLLEASVTALERAESYEADRLIAERVGTRALAGLVARTAILDAYVSDTYLPRVLARAGADASFFQPFVDMEAALATTDVGQEGQSILERQPGAVYGASGGLSSLEQRLGALGGSVLIEKSSARVSAGRHVLGPRMDDLARSLDELWLTGEGRIWQQLQVERNAAALDLKRIQRVEETGSLKPDDLLRKGRDTETLDGGSAALSIYRAILAADPTNLSAQYDVGRLLLAEDDMGGIGLLHHVAFSGGNTSLATKAAQRAREYLLQKGQLSEAMSYAWRLDELASVNRTTEKEGKRPILAGDGLIAHGLDSVSLVSLRQRLEASPEIKRAYLVRRLCGHSSQDSHLVLAVMMATHRYNYLSMERLRSLVDELRATVELPDAFEVIGLNPSADGALVRRIKKVNQARVC